MKVRTSADDDNELRPRRSATYPVGIVGEANYQLAIRRCFVGQRVQVVRELGNPYDEKALAVVEGGETIGYIARDSWLQDAIHEEGHGCEAAIKAINSADAGELGVVLEVSVGGPPLTSRHYNPLEAAVDGASPAASGTTERTGWFSRLFGP